MVLKANGAKYRYNKELYSALMREEGDEVIRLCQQNPDGPLYILTLHQDTVLHMAIHSRQTNLVLSLLKDLPEHQFPKLMHTNDLGNTVLHEAATADSIVPAAKEILIKAPKLLSKCNRQGEMPLFRAARYGQKRMFEFLDDEINKSIQNEADLKVFHYRKDTATILHLAVQTEHFDIALLIARKYEYLLNEKDDDGMTALQLLAINPSAFDKGRTQGSLQQFFYSCISSLTTTTTNGARTCTIPMWESIQMQKRNYESAVKLAKLLIERDTSWEDTEIALNPSKPKTHKYTSKTSQGQGVEVTSQKAASSNLKSAARIALFLAAKSGIMEIVEEILMSYPQAIEKVGKAFPRCASISPKSSTTPRVKFQKSQAAIPSKPSQAQGSSSTSHFQLEIE
ncbi:unnamed protein product [Ilex paraguariensis]|uniref:Uncharacterized protein n=1 Tax=Ilex paraguariensis TaxID=185542 RepID=A0ABC8QXE6_9AQUA